MANDGCPCQQQGHAVDVSEEIAAEDLDYITQYSIFKVGIPI
jgi:hypothetical protein